MLDRTLTGHPPVDVERVTGISSQEALRRHKAGQGNETQRHSGRSTASIIKANTLTRFNAIIACLTLVVLVFGEPIDAVFGVVMVLNSTIGISQELRAKRSLDSLQVLLVPSIGVIRDGKLVPMPPAELVLGDAVRLEPGDQIPVDGQVLSSDGLEVDESALTGESVPVPKSVGSQALSGSFVVAGAATIEATAVGLESWASKITAEAKDFVLTESELRVGIDRLLRTISWILPPLSALLLWSQLRVEPNVADAMVSAVAGVVALVPQGLVLLVSMTFAIGVIRLARNQVVVQELPAVEGLARVDVLCVDKTGTLTTGRLSVDRIVTIESDAIVAHGATDGPLAGANQSEAELAAGLAALVQLDAARSGTSEALREHLGQNVPGWTVTQVVPFSSVRKWSAATFIDHGTWILGAPEVLFDSFVDRPSDDLRRQFDEPASAGRRVLLVARSHSPLMGEQLPADAVPWGLVSLKEEVRPDAAETIEYFHRQQVAVHVLSGDNPRTVAAVAAELGIKGSHNHLDMRSAAGPDDIAPGTTVFGRVLPEQKRDIVRWLQAQGHTVAMTGDGVNDIPALKAADIGIAMNTATSATKAISQLVLVDGRFDHLPTVVGEGRRIIANMERVSSLFVTKTVYATLLALMVGVFGVSFPFLPRHLTLIGALTIGIPGFVLSLLPSSEPSRTGYLRRVLRFSIPAGIVAASATFATFWVARSPLGNAGITEARTAATITMTLTGLWILYRLMRPLDRLKVSLIASMVVVLVLALIPAPWSDIYALGLPPGRTTGLLVAVVLSMIAALEVLLAVNDRVNRDSSRGV